MRDRTVYSVIDTDGVQHIRVVEAGHSHAEAWTYIMSIRPAIGGPYR